MSAFSTALARRAGGDRPSPVHAAVASVIAAAAVAALTYRLMRS